MTRTVAVVPHTHWDREWYRSFQSFRSRLVPLLDDLLPRLEHDPSIAHFLLDGQMAVVDDYLEIRPEAEDTLRRLATSGRLGMGPWYVLMDEFLVSGETIVRNMQMGLTRAASFGGAMRVGYLPDMFGHIAQMPQILSQFGFEHAVVWRGTPSAIDRTAFWWQAPDGSTVRAEYLPQGYGNGAVLPDDPKDLVEHVREFHATHDARLGDGPILWMNGTDHLVPFATVGDTVAGANALQDDYRLQIMPLADYLASAPTTGLPSWSGELRSGARANLLMGVASNRTDVRQAAAVAERWLERIAEPVAALATSVGAPWPRRFLEIAWRQVVVNSAHDSVCACSIDEVCDAVLVRYAEATDIARAVTDQAIDHIGGELAAGEVAIVNTSARTRSGLVHLELPGTGDGEGVQVLHQRPAVELVHTVDRAHAATVVERELDIHLGVQGIELVHADDGALDVTLHVDPSDRRVPTFGWAVRQLRSLAAEAPDGVVRVHVDRPPSRTVLTRAVDVPGLGWATWVPGAAPETAVTVSDDGTTMSNGLLEVVIDPADATFALDGRTGFGRLVDEGDEGDTYNFSPPAQQSIVDRPESVDIEVIERGPLRARVAITAGYRLPHRIVDGARVGERLVEVVTTLEVHTGDRLVRITTELDNAVRDHRLRVWLPLPHPSATSEAECAFGLVSRGLDAEGGETEEPLATAPSRRFVRAGGLTVVHEGLLEYELVDIADGRARAVALTLLRCTGWLSRGPMAYRPLPAGPQVETPGAQLQGPITMRWAIHVTSDGSTPPDPYALVDDAFVPLLVANGRGTGSVPSRVHWLDLRGAEVSAVDASGPSCTVRVFNPGGAPTTVEVPGRSGWVLDLAGRAVAPFQDRVELAPHRIATLSFS
ncbi:MAG: glycoside hydrolase family 38 N-terminal domain-containing protein [Acidimicrobiales bacterium]